MATSKSTLPLNNADAGPTTRTTVLADTNEEDYKTTTSNNGTDRILIRTILKKMKKSKRMGRRINNTRDEANALERRRSSSHPDTTERKGKMTKVKVYRRKAERVTAAGETPKEEEPKKATKNKTQKKQKVLLKRKLYKSIETIVELKTRPRTYTYFVTRKNGEEGSDEFVSSSTEVRDFTYPVTVSRTVYRTESQHQVVMTSLVPTSF